jgi:hypothetical protein
MKVSDAIGLIWLLLHQAVIGLLLETVHVDDQVLAFVMLHPISAIGWANIRSIKSLLRQVTRRRRAKSSVRIKRS